jgi:glycosyltransferase involved in cell wall biosynthesis
MIAKVVLFISHSSKLYGAERSLLTLVSGLQRGGAIRPVVLVPGRGPLVDALREAEIPVIVRRSFNWYGRDWMPIRAAACLVINFLSLVAMIPRVRSLKPDVVYTNSLASPLGILIAQWFDVPHIWHAREFVHEDLRADYVWGEKRSMAMVGKSARVICNSEAVRKKLSGKIDEEILVVVYNGFEFNTGQRMSGAERYDRCVSSAEGIQLLTMSSVQAGKGQEDAIRALPILVSRGLEVRLRIVGSGRADYIAYLKSLARTLSVSDRIGWHGYVDDKQALLDEAAVVLVCSRSEAFGRVAVEAMAEGIPVVGTASGGLPEIIGDDDTGLLYKPEDYKGLAMQIERLLRDSGFYSGVAERGRESVVARFGINQYVSGIQKIIEKAVEHCSV